MDRDASRLAAAADLFTIEHTIVAGDDASSAVLDATGGDGFDVVFDATGSRQSIEAAFGYAGHGGSYVLVSVVKGEITFTDADFHRKELTLIGSRNATTQDFERVIEAVRQGKVSTAKWITHRTTLTGAVTDLPRWAREKTGLIKAVIEMA